ncbi:MAG: hypothetical protein EHM36_14050, partial [Deltaproteobacteria bacterium]
MKGRGVEVRLTTPRLVEVEPGKIVTGSALVVNQSVQDEDFLEELNLPSGWNLVTPLSAPFHLKSNQRQVRIFAFQVPFTAAAMGYPLTYSVRSQPDYAITNRNDFSVVVLPVVKLQMQIEDKPETVIAGETYQAKVLLIQGGNSRITVKIAIKGTPNFPIRIEPAEATLDPETSQALRIEVKTDETLKKRVIHIFNITAQAETLKNGPFTMEGSGSVEVFPRVTGEADPYHRINAQLKFTGATGSGGSGGQAEFSGSGSLDEQGKRRIDFLFRGPDLQQKSLFGLPDEYRVSYFTPTVDLLLGDRGYSLSPLTERFRYGRGAEADLHLGSFDVGAYYLGTRWEEPAQTEFGSFARYRFSDAVSVKGNFLEKQGKLTSSERFNAQIYSIESKINSGKWLNLELEYGLSKSGREKSETDTAYRVYASGQLFDQAW